MMTAPTTRPPMAASAIAAPASANIASTASMLTSRVAGGCLMNSTTMGPCCRRDSTYLHFTPGVGVHRELHEGSDSHAGGPFRLVGLRIFGPCRSCDIHVRPGQAA